ncbi:MAG: DEAD/DEAH box helicase [Bacteroidales bacterium]|nr:DEAD/DEAH box helicase [Bacteroidales bacterium]
MLTFKELGVSPDLLRGIEELGFQTPTPIQEEIIPLFFDCENDIVGLAQTGTGKTAAFGLPIIDQCDTSITTVQSLILSPTRELCIQIAKDLENYGKHVKGLRVTPIYGGASIDNQIRDLKRGTQIIVATPGRMLDMIKRKRANITEIHTVVLDEADEMLNMGFRDELDAILEQTPKGKRTLLFSATMPSEVARIANTYMHDPVRISVGKENSGADNVKHLYYQVHAKDRYPALKRIADINPDIYGLVFCRTRAETKDTADKLIKDGYNADALHGDLSQSQRDHVMKRFRERTLQMLVATDVAARGLDVREISHVINYNLPDDIEDYIHRSGRTGRADKHGISISIVNFRERSRIPQLEKILGKKIEKQNVPNGSEICGKQLFNMIDKMEHVNVDEKQIAPFMETVMKKLEWLDKEEIIKRFVSLEFNRFLEYYKNAPDLNKIDKRDSGDPRDRGGRDRGGRERGGRERGDRDRGRDNGRERDNGRRERNRSDDRQGGFTKLFINVGRVDGVNPPRLIGMINDNARDRDITIGSIKIEEKHTIFQVGDQYAEKVISALSKTHFKGREVKVDFSGEEPGKKSKKKKAKKK